MNVGGAPDISQSSASNAVQVKVLVKQRDQLEAVAAIILQGIQQIPLPTPQTGKGQLINVVV